MVDYFKFKAGLNSRNSLGNIDVLLNGRTEIFRSLADWIAYWYAYASYHEEAYEYHLYQWANVLPKFFRILDLCAGHVWKSRSLSRRSGKLLLENHLQRLQNACLSAEIWLSKNFFDNYKLSFDNQRERKSDNRFQISFVKSKSHKKENK